MHQQIRRTVRARARRDSSAASRTRTSRTPPRRFPSVHADIHRTLSPPTGNRPSPAIPNFTKHRSTPQDPSSGQRSSTFSDTLRRLDSRSVCQACRESRACSPHDAPLSRWSVSACMTRHWRGELKKLENPEYHCVSPLYSSGSIADFLDGDFRAATMASPACFLCGASSLPASSFSQ